MSLMGPALIWSIRMVRIQTSDFQLDASPGNGRVFTPTAPSTPQIAPDLRPSLIG